MNDRRGHEDRLYTVVVIAFLLGLVALGLFGVPDLLVAAIGVAVAAVAIVACRSVFARRDAAPARRAPRTGAPEHYVPSVLEGSSLRRRRTGLFKRHRHASAPLRFH